MSFSAKLWDNVSSGYTKMIETLHEPLFFYLFDRLKLLPVPPQDPSSSTSNGTHEKETVKLIDIAAGTGYLSVLLADAYEKADALDRLNIYASDFSSGIVATMKKRFEERGWPTSRVKGDILDANDVDTLPSNTYTHAVCTGAIYFVKDPAKFVAELLRIIRPGGFIGLSSTARKDWLMPIAETLARIRKCSVDEIKLPSPYDPQWADESYFRELLKTAGFVDVETHMLNLDSFIIDNQHECARIFVGPPNGLTDPVLDINNVTEEERHQVPEVFKEVLQEMQGSDLDKPVHFAFATLVSIGVKPDESAIV